jgi:16S rRNA pseudouridine516 synthase
MRLDKYLANANTGSRKEVNKLIRKGSVAVNGEQVKSPKTDVSYDDHISLNGEIIELEELIYIMLNKPQGVISSTEDGPTKTVIDVIDHPQKETLFPVGRLDKDTTGLLLITNDGKLAHQLTSPRKDAGKTYHVTLRDAVGNDDLTPLREGVPLKDFTAKPAVAEIVSRHEVLLTITEGKFHQVKRMFAYVGNEVVGLKRVSFAGLRLDESLSAGEYRPLTNYEIKNLKN